jgi:hypothetical protein
LIDSQDAYYLAHYAKVEPTLFDSTAVCNDYHYFQIIAHTDTAMVFWISNVDSGYSVDNIAPCPPQCLAGEQSSSPEGLTISWSANSEPDLDGYRIYRGLNEDFTPVQGNLLSGVCDTLYFDGGWRWDSGFYYKVAALDVHGNESGYSLLSPGQVTGLDTPLAARTNFLLQNYPNPFNPLTTIRFGLKVDGNVSLRIYDATGRLIRVLIDGRRKADVFVESWDGLDGAGNAVASGVYFYRLVAGDFVQTKKMVLLR